MFCFWILSPARGAVDVCLLLSRSPFGSQHIWIPKNGVIISSAASMAVQGPPRTRLGCFHPCFFFPVSSLAPMPHRSGWSCSLRETSGCSSLSRMLMRPSLRLLLTLLLLQALRTLCRPTDEGTTLVSLLAPPSAGNAVNVGSV